MTNFSVTKNGKVLDPSLYNWDEKTKAFSSKEEGLVLDFAGIAGVTFYTGHSCTFKTGSDCTFRTGNSCTFDTRFCCTFNTGDYCTFNTTHSCTFKTGHSCTFNTGSSCSFKTGPSCTFKTGSICTFEVGENCCSIRADVEGVTEIPAYKKIKLNDYGIAGYTFIKEKKEVPTCNGKVVEIEGKKYKLVEAKE